MAGIKLGKLPDRTPVKLTISVPPDLKVALEEYASAYARAYGAEEAIVDLIPAILAAFLESDREFRKVRNSQREQAGSRAGEG